MATPDELAKKLSAREWRKQHTPLMRKLAGEAADAARKAAPRGQRRGNHIPLADTLQGHVTRVGQQIKVTSTNPDLLGWVTGGTAPHIIEASSARALHFTIGGADFFAKSVQHPGTAPNPFLEQAAEDAEDEAERLLLEAGEKFFDTVDGL